MKIDCVLSMFRRIIWGVERVHCQELLLKIGIRSQGPRYGYESGGPNGENCKKG